MDQGGQPWRPWHGDGAERYYEELERDLDRTERGAESDLEMEKMLEVYEETEKELEERRGSKSGCEITGTVVGL